MFGYEFSSEEKQNILTDIIMIAIIVAWAFFINRTMRISGLYMDDLYMWSCFGEQSFRQYVFPIGSTRFRPVYWFAAWIELGFIKNHIAWIVPINIMINIGIAVTLYMFVKKLATSRPVALITGIMFITSRLAYYQIGQLLGLMESMALWLVLIIVWLLYNYMHEHRKIYYYLGLLAYFLVSFTHERYMVLIPMFFFVLIVIRSKDIKTWISPLFVVAVIQFIRVMTIGSVLPAGTGGTQVAATVTLMGTIKNIVVQILYIFGVNAGPDYLSGMPWENTPFIVKIGVLVSGIILLLLIIVFIYCLIVGKIKKIKHINVLPDLILLIGFIIGSVVASAVTIRVEMRWVYVSYTILLIIIAYIYGFIKNYCQEKSLMMDPKLDISAKKYIPITLIIIWALIMIPIEIVYRSSYPNIYLFPDQERYNSLADETYGKYGDEILGKNIYIIGNSYEMSDFTAETFFKVFDPDRTGQGTTVTHVSSIRDFGQLSNNMIVLKEDKEHNSFTDVTDMVKSLKCETIKGYYSDGWMDEEAEINVMAGADGDIVLELMYPGMITGKEDVTILTDEETMVINLKENVSYTTVHVKPYQVVNLKFKNNFIMPNAQEVRGQTKLSLIVNISSK